MAMNRVIKFRVWDYCANAFIDNGEGIRVQDGLGEDHFGYEVEYQQFTGLKDQSGNDVYEGDVLYINKHNTLREVIFDRGSFRLKDLGYILDTIDLDVFGNIFENPELLS